MFEKYVCPEDYSSGLNCFGKGAVTISSKIDEKYMGRALALAKKAVGLTSPNPLVGAVIVRDGRIVGEGFHAEAGGPHAEVLAIKKAGKKAGGATIYVNLEPCSHYGRTGPCTEAILRAGLSKAVVAMKDPNPLVAGRGIKRLREGGMDVRMGVLSREAARLNEVFIKYITTGLPFVVFKTAMSLDGKIATATGESQWITGPEARERVHELRHMYDGILVGIGTVLSDNPSLTCRLPGGGGRDPIRVVLDSRCRIPPDATLLTQKSSAPTIVAVAVGAPAERVEKIRDMGAEIIFLESGKEGIDLNSLMHELGSRGVTGLLVEGGSKIASSFFKEGLVDKVCWFIAPKVIGGKLAPGPVGGKGIASLNEAGKISLQKVERFGDDLYIEGYLNEGGADENVYGNCRGDRQGQINKTRK